MAKVQIEANDRVAAAAVDLFLRNVREPLLAEAAARSAPRPNGWSPRCA